MRSAFCVAVLAPWLVLAACRGTSDPVAELTVAPEELELQLGSFVELSIVVRPLVDLPPGVVPQVFLHIVDEPGSRHTGSTTRLDFHHNGIAQARTSAHEPSNCDGNRDAHAYLCYLIPTH